MSELAVHALRRGGFRGQLAWLDSRAAPGQIVYEPITFFLIRHPDATLLFDCGVSPARASSPTPQSDRGYLDLRPTDTAAAALDELGVSPSHVTHVVLSHLHYDHVGGLCQFPAATAVVQRIEAEYAVEARHAYDPSEFAAHQDWVLIEGETDLLGDGLITLIPTPGHTPGHQSALVRLVDQALILAGDAAGHPSLLKAGRMPPRTSTWNLRAFTSTWQRLLKLQQESGALLIGAHDLDWESNVNRPDVPYR